mmetsp:Transcript_19138/g.31874  ORF Transcript_19138/g.31874 Transcript_19138/m.31874 type:complete len:399 (+) Transcript_19138:78-1274(+)
MFSRWVGLSKNLRCVRSMCTSQSSGQNVSKSKARLAGEKMAKQRRMKEEAMLGAESEGGSYGGILASAGVLGAIGAAGYFSFSEDGNKWFMKNVYEGTPFGQGVKVCKSFIGQYFKSFTDPISDELLPDFPVETLPPGMRAPRTLVLDFEDTLCHLEWDRKNGWRAVKRPGVDQLLNRLSMYYEIVLFTSGNAVFLEPFVRSLDPLNIMPSRLYREATVYVDGDHIKDLSHLNRDLSRVVVLDDELKSCAYQPDNLVQVKPFTNPMERDTELFDIIPFLEDLCERDVPDVRAEIAKYKGKNIGQAFKQELAERRKREEEQRKGTLGGALRKGGLFGGAGVAAPRPPPVPVAPAQQQPVYDIPMTPIGAAENLPPAGEKPTGTADAKKEGSIWSSMLGK